MSDELPGMLPPQEGSSAFAGAPHLVDVRTGVLPYQRLVAMVQRRAINSVEDIQPDQLQPASLDLRLGDFAYRVRASFLPGAKASVMDRVAELDGMPPIDLRNGAILERGAVYVVELQEAVALPSDVVGVANPKSSTGRLDILTRLITDRATSFDLVEAGYEGRLYLEVAPLTFSVIAHRGARLSQLRLQKGARPFPLTDARRYYEGGQLIRSDAAPHLLRDNGLVPVTVDLQGSGPDAIVGFKAKKNSSKIDLRHVDHYDPREFWSCIERGSGRLNLEKDEFYILATCEDVGVPQQLAAEMVPYDTRSGEFRVHYAGFFDPGFGWNEETGAGGSKAVLEVRSHGVPFTLEHGQIVGWLRYAHIAGGHTDRLYGGEGIKSNYQGQGLALAKQFKRWPA